MAYTDNDTPEEVFGVGYSSDGSSISLTIESSGYYQRYLQRKQMQALEITERFYTD